MQRLHSFTCTLLFLSVLVFTSCGSKKNTQATAVVKEVNAKYIQKFHEAARLKQIGQVEASIRLFEECITMNDKDDAVYFALSELYRMNKQAMKAQESIIKAAKLDPENQWYTQEVAYMHLERNEFDLAAVNFQKLVKKDPRNIDFLFAYAESLVRAGKTADAVKALDKLEEQVGLNPQLSIEKFRLYRQMKQDEKGLAELNKGLEIFPQDAQLLANLVDYYFEKKQSEKAFQLLMRLAESDPQNGNAHLALAQYYDQKGDRKKSYESLNKAFASPDIEIDQKMKIWLSMFETQASLDPEMLELVNTIIRFHPQDAKSHTLLGDYHKKANNDELALSAFKQALNFEKNKFVIWEQVLNLEYELQQYEALYQDSKACLVYFTSLNRVYLFNGIGALQTKRYSEAIDAFTIGLELVTSEKDLKSEFLAQRGEAHFLLKNTKSGIEDYEAALKLSPTSNYIKNNYAYRLAIAKIKFDLAEKLIKEVVLTAPTNGHFLDTYGWILFQQGKFQEAEIQLKNALVILENDPQINEHLGDVYSQLKQTQNALIYWQKAKEFGSTNTLLDKKIQQKTYYEPID